MIVELVVIKTCLSILIHLHPEYCHDKINTVVVDALCTNTTLY